MKNAKYTLLFILTLILSACSKEEPITDFESSNLKFSNGIGGISSFVFRAKYNKVLTEDIVAHIDSKKKIIMATAPSGTNLASLIPSIESSWAQYSPTGAQDFRKPIRYTFKPKFGKEEKYIVVVEEEERPTEKEILLKIAALNPGNTLGWNTDMNLSDFPGVTLDSQDRISDLRIFNSRIRTVPKEIGFLDSLKYLGLSDNQIVTLPKEIGKLSKLETLILQDNSLVALPNEIGQLSMLRNLDVQFNFLSSLPAEMGNLSNLEILSLNVNQISEWPSCLSGLDNLIYLFNGENSLSEIPADIGNLENLVFLTLDFNELTSIPQELSQLTMLRRLYLSRNELTSIPQELSQLTMLQSLYLFGNQITSLPPEICALDTFYGGNVEIDIVPEEVQCQ